VPRSTREAEASGYRIKAGSLGPRLVLQGAWKAELAEVVSRLSCFPKLEECFLTWRPRAKSLFDSRSVRRLYVDRFRLKDAEGFGSMSQVESPAIANGPLESVQPLESIAELRKLRLRRLRGARQNGVQRR
jgi:hypothetical protein